MRLPRLRRTVTLVIDDGPSDSTLALLSLLEAGGHRAVLFIMGANVVGREAVLVEAVKRGFALANHGFSHARFSGIDLDTARAEIADTEALIVAAYDRGRARRPGKWFRFPYLDSGEANHDALQDLLRASGFTPPPGKASTRIDWPSTLITRDWALPAEAEVRATLAGARAGDLIEFHDKVETFPYAPALVEALAALRLRATVP